MNFGPPTDEFICGFSTHPRSTLSDTIFRPLGGPAGCNFYTRLRMTNASSAHPIGDGGPPTIFNDGHSKIGLKFGVCARITLGLGGGNLTKLFRVTCREAGMIKWIQFLGGLPPLQYGRAKTVQNLVRFCATSHFDRKYLRNG